MLISVDYDRCEGHGLCEEKAPDVFQLDEQGDLHVTYDNTALPVELEGVAGEAVAVCPVAALRLSP